jgi:ribonuclease P protein component
MKSSYKQTIITKYTEIKKITQSGEKFVLKSCIAYKIPAEKWKFGILISKKFGNAVKRNLAKRRIRAALTLIKEKPKIHLVFIPRQQVLNINFEAMQEELKNLL